MADREQWGLGISEEERTGGTVGRKAAGGPAWRVPECPRCRAPWPAPWPARWGQGGGHRADDAQVGWDRFSAAWPGAGRGACRPGELRPCPDLRGGGPSGRGAGLTQGEAERQGRVGELQALLGRLRLSQQRGQLVAQPQLGLLASRGHRQGQRPVLRGQGQVRPPPPATGSQARTLVRAPRSAPVSPRSLAC